MKNLFCILCILFTCQRGFSTNNVLENEYYKLIFDIDTGSYTIIDKIHKEVCLENAYYQLNQWKSNDPLFSHEIKEKTASSLYIVSKSMQSPELHLRIVLESGNFFSFIIRKSKFPQNPKRSVRFSGKRTKRSVQKRKARNTQKAETKVL